MFINRTYKNARKNNTGQSTIEYIVLVTAVIAVIILLVFDQNSIFRQKVNSTLSSQFNTMESKGQALDNSHVSVAGVSGPSEITVNILGNNF